MVNTLQIGSVLDSLYRDAQQDHLKMMQSRVKSIFRPMQPADFDQAYLAILREQGEFLTQLIVQKELRNLVEFGTSFGISTLFLAEGVLETSGRIVTTELIASKAEKARENFKKAGVDHLIEIKVGDARDTLKGHKEPVDLLLLDGWKNLYLALFLLLEPNFHPKTLIYVDNADMIETRNFLHTILKDRTYQCENLHAGKAALITLRN
ncbi:MAG: class I SAM-dependent methyltransferase [Bacteroidota bacterium]